MFVPFKLDFPIRFYDTRSIISPINNLTTFKDGIGKLFTNLYNATLKCKKPLPYRQMFMKGNLQHLAVWEMWQEKQTVDWMVHGAWYDA